MPNQDLLDDLARFIRRDLINTEMFRGQDLIAAVSGRDIEYRNAASRFVLMEHDAIDDIQELAMCLASEFLENFDLEAEDELGKSVARDKIARDLFVIAMAKTLNLDDPFANGVLVSYRAGVLPTATLLIAGKVSELLSISAEEARRLSHSAHAAHDTARLEKEQAQGSTSLALANSGQKLPPGELLYELLKPQTDAPGFKDSGTQIATTAADLPKGTTVPSGWRALLTAQDQGGKLPWSAVWPQLEKAMPAVFDFLETKCFGVGVLLRKKYPPALLYFYRFPSDALDVGYQYGAYLGGLPLGNRPARAAKDKLDLLPDKLVHFYQEVHDGWVELLLDVAGPLPIQRISFLKESVQPADTKIPVATSLQIMRLRGGGDALCLETEKRAKSHLGHIYRNQGKDILNKDFLYPHQR